MKYTLDTSAHSAPNRHQRRLKAFINPENEIYIPLIMIAKLRAGFMVGNQQRANESILSDLLDAPNIDPAKATRRDKQCLGSSLRPPQTNW